MAAKLTPKFLVLVCISMVALTVGAYFITPYLQLEGRASMLCVVAAHGIAVWLREYPIMKERKSLSRMLVNYHCPLCRYFVGADTRVCPKCKLPITPVAD
jgi:hypothetical protein